MARQQGIGLYSGRLWRVCEPAVGDSARLTLELGVTTYREYVGTREPAFVQGRNRGELANPLAVCAALITRDDKIVVARRRGVDVAVGRYSVPGGFMERGKDEDPFAAIAREVDEETGIQIGAEGLVCLGLLYDLVYPHYELCFATRVGDDMASLMALEPIDRESGALESVADDGSALATFLAEKRGMMSPSGEGCLVLYERFRFGNG